MTEYPKITHPEYFRDKFSIPTEDMMRTRFRASPYIVKGTETTTMITMFLYIKARNRL